MVFQGFNLLSRRTVYGNVALPLKLPASPRPRSQPAWNACWPWWGTEHLRDRYPSQISGGQKQVGIARALC